MDLMQVNGHDNLLFLDESALFAHMVPVYGRSIKGTRLYCPEPGGRKKHFSMIAVLSPEGIKAPMAIQGTVNGAVFRSYVEQVLVPELKPGQAVVMDNLRVHKDPKAIRLIERANAKVIFLPPYSPDLSPIENAWSKIKAIIKSFKVKTEEKLYQAIAKAIKKVTRKDSRNWFRHCGYQLQPLS